MIFFGNIFIRITRYAKGAVMSLKKSHLLRCAGTLLLLLLFVQTCHAQKLSSSTQPVFEVYDGPFQLDRITRKFSSPYKGPMIDTHTHILQGLAHSSIDKVLGDMNEAGITNLIVLPTPNEGKMRTRDTNAKLRRQITQTSNGQIARLCGSTYLTRWMNTAFRKGYTRSHLHELLNRLSDDLENADCQGIGEIGPYHFDKKPGMGIIHFPLHFEPMLKLAALAEQKNVVLDLHAEPRKPDGTSYQKEIIRDIGLIYHHYPNLKLILSHTGMTHPKNARALLETYPNIMMNIKIVSPGKRLKWDHLGPIENADSQLFEDWALFFEQMPEKFMIGTDARFGTRQYQGNRYLKSIKALRQLLGCLPKEAARKIAYQNARQLFFNED